MHEAVAQELARGKWDMTTRTIVFPRPDGERSGVTVSSRSELVEYLCKVASAAFSGQKPRDNRVNMKECDEDGIVQDELLLHEGRLNAFFGEETQRSIWHGER